MNMVELGHSYDHRPGQYSHSHRGSPHLQHLDHSSVHSTTPSPPYRYAHLPMIPQQQQQAPPPPARPTPTSYPSPASYPSPSMSAYQHPSGLQQQQQPGSRGSPYSQPISLPSLNLPPIRLNPPAQLPPPPPPQQQQVGSPLLSSPLAQPSQPHHGYYPQHGLQPSSHPTHPSNITSSPREALRFQLPSANNERIMSGGRHKKEIKRRTKTGCLTCRKRRIKCDEAHPTCKNCAKSKRDCLGYDPIFKPQPGPAAIQPAPSIGGSTPQSIAPLYSFSYPVSNPLGGQNCAQTNSTAASSPSSEVYDYQPAIDPALEAPTMGNPPTSTSILPESQGTFRPELKRSLDRDSPFSSGSDTTNRVTHIPRSTTPGLGRLQDNPGGNPAKRIKIDDLLSVVSSSQPLTPPSSETALYATPSATVEDMKTLYKSRYAPALDKFLETGWFMGEGLTKVLSDNHLVELMAEIFERFRVRGGSFVQEEDPSIGRKGKSAGVLWAGVKMVYGTSIPAADNRQDEDEGDFRDEDGAETLRRINVVEALVTGQPLEPMPESPRVTSADKITDDSPTTLFWRFLGRVVAARGGDAEINRQIDNTFADCKQFFEGKETRKLLLTIAEARHLGSSRPYHTLADPTVAEDSTRPLGSLRSYIESIAKGTVESGSSLGRRIAGRAVGQWKEAITDTPFLC